MHPASFSLSLLQSWRHTKSQFCTWMRLCCVFMSVHCDCKALWDTSVMGSVSPIVDLLDGGSDNILPSGHLRSVITLHLPRPALLQGMSMHQRTQFGENAWFEDNLLAFSFLWQPFNIIDPLIALNRIDWKVTERWWHHRPWVNRERERLEIQFFLETQRQRVCFVLVVSVDGSVEIRGFDQQ